MSISSRIDKIEKHLKCVNVEGGERFFMVEISQEGRFDVSYHQTLKDGKMHKENIPNAMNLTQEGYEEYVAKYMNENSCTIIDDIV